VGKAIGKGKMATREEIRARIAAQIEAGAKWRDLDKIKEFGNVSMATLNRIYKDKNYEPVDRKTRRALGLDTDRIRIAADLDTETQRAVLHEWAAPFGGWSAFCRDFANALLALEIDKKPEDVVAE
jgi:hypothetical protein